MPACTYACRVMKSVELRTNVGFSIFFSSGFPGCVVSSLPTKVMKLPAALDSGPFVVIVEVLDIVNMM